MRHPYAARPTNIHNPVSGQHEFHHPGSTFLKVATRFLRFLYSTYEIE
jgi:hypothetical protein